MDKKTNLLWTIQQCIPRKNSTFKYKRNTTSDQPSSSTQSSTTTQSTYIIEKQRPPTPMPKLKFPFRRLFKKPLNDATTPQQTQTFKKSKNPKPG